MLFCWNPSSVRFKPRNLLKNSTLVAITLLLAVQVGAENLDPLKPTAAQQRTTKEIVRSLTTRHYRDLPVDDMLSARYFDDYIDMLDGTKSFLFKSDIDEFQRYRNQFDDYLKNGDLEAGYSIYNRYRDRVVIRLEATIARLKSDDFNLDFNKDEFLETDEERMEWATDLESANEMWHKLVKSRLLATILEDDPDGAGALDENGKYSEEKFAAQVQDAKNKWIKRFENQLNRITQQNSTDVHEAMMNTLAQLYDPHTSYLAPRTFENFNIDMSLSLEGIGAELRQDEEQYTIVNRVVLGGPAYKQGDLKRDDKIIAVAQGDEGEFIDVIGKRLDEVVQLIRGPRDTVVRLKVTSEKVDAGSSVIRIVRNEVKLEDQAARKGVQTFTDGNTVFKIGVIEVPGFYIDFEAYRRRDPNYRSTTRDVHRLLDELEQENVDGIIIDLRQNGGGSLQEAEMLTDLFIDPGPVVQIRQSDDKIFRTSGSSRSLAKYRGPLLVLINRLSASASEIFAGAIQDYKRGLIVGSQSFGKGTVQSLTPVYEGQMKITESKFYRVSGDSTQHRGVIPDIVYPEFFVDIEKVGESAYDNALPWDKIHPVPHAQYFDMSGIVTPLQSAHDKRSLQDPDFVYLTEINSFNKELSDRKQISLNIKNRRTELQDRLHRRLDIENKRRRTKGLELYKTFDEYEEKEEVIAEKRQDEEYETNVVKIDPSGDPVLNETALVLVDFIKMIEAGGEQKVANF